VTALRYTLLTDGSSDRVLLPLINWLLRQHSQNVFNGEWADLRRLVDPPHTLTDRIQKALEIYPCDLLFVHRDAERVARNVRVTEIHAALDGTGPAVCVVPVRMQEAWFLFNEDAIRTAAGRPKGREQLRLPPLQRCESVSDPKVALRDALVRASGLSGRKRRHFPVMERTYRVAELIEDFSPLRRLSAFKALETDLTTTLEGNGWA